MIKFLKGDTSTLGALSETLTEAYNKVRSLGGCPGAVKILDLGSEDVGVVFNHAEIDESAEVQLQEKKMFFITTSVDEANEFIKEEERVGADLSTPYIFAKNGEIIIFVVAEEYLPF